jgi:hypothetical protein
MHGNKVSKQLPKAQHSLLFGLLQRLCYVLLPLMFQLLLLLLPSLLYQLIVLLLCSSESNRLKQICDAPLACWQHRWLWQDRGRWRYAQFISMLPANIHGT